MIVWVNISQKGLRRLAVKILSLHVFIVTDSIFYVRPITVANDADLAVHKVFSVCRVEEQHWQRQDRSDDPNDERNAQRRFFPHTRPQRIHDSYVPEIEHKRILRQANELTGTARNYVIITFAEMMSGMEFNVRLSRRRNLRRRKFCHKFSGR